MHECTIEIYAKNMYALKLKNIYPVPKVITI